MREEFHHLIDHLRSRWRRCLRWCESLPVEGGETLWPLPSFAGGAGRRQG